MIINFLLFLTTLFVFCGLALDVGMMQLRKLQLQHAADAAALGAATEKARGNAGWVAAGKADATLNGFTDGVGGVSISVQSPPASGTYAGDTTAVQATVTQSVHTAFLVFLGFNTASPGAMAVAKGGAAPGCLYIMNANASAFYPLSIMSNGNLNSACDVYVDSSNKSIQASSNSNLTVTNGKATKVQGSSSGASVPGGTMSPSPTFNSANQNDPLASVTSPAFSSCTYSNKVVGSWLTGWLFPTYATLNPGTYCSGLTTYYAHITLNPGLYIFTGSSSLNNSTFSGSGITFFLTQGGGSGYGNFTITNVTATISAPTSTSGGGVTGIFLFGDRNWSDQGSQDVQISGSTLTIDGIWYVLNTGISLSSTTIQGTNYAGFVTDNLAFSNSSTITVPAPDYTSLTGGSPYAGAGGGLVQ